MTFIIHWILCVDLKSFRFNFPQISPTFTALWSMCAQAVNVLMKVRYKVQADSILTPPSQKAGEAHEEECKNGKTMSLNISACIQNTRKHEKLCLLFPRWLATSLHRQKKLLIKVIQFEATDSLIKCRFNHVFNRPSLAYLHQVTNSKLMKVKIHHSSFTKATDCFHRMAEESVATHDCRRPALAHLYTKLCFDGWTVNLDDMGRGFKSRKIADITPPLNGINKRKGRQQSKRTEL